MAGRPHRSASNRLHGPTACDGNDSGWSVTDHPESLPSHAVGPWDKSTVRAKDSDSRARRSALLGLHSQSANRARCVCAHCSWGNRFVNCVGRVECWLILRIAFVEYVRGIRHDGASRYWVGGDSVADATFRISAKTRERPASLRSAARLERPSAWPRLRSFRWKVASRLFWEWTRSCLRTIRSNIRGMCPCREREARGYKVNGKFD